jgi:Tol biopolymer transport system component
VGADKFQPARRWPWRIGQVRWSADGDWLAAEAYDNARSAIVIWDSRSDQIEKVLPTPGYSSPCLDWSPLTPLLAYCQDRHIVQVLDARSGRQVDQTRLWQHPPLQITWSPTGNRIAIRTLTGTFIWTPQLESTDWLPAISTGSSESGNRRRLLA